MSWHDPRTWVTGETVTSVHMNEDVRDNFRETWHEIKVQEFTSSIGPGSEWTSDSVTFTGNPIRLHFFIPASVGPNAGSSSLSTNWRKDGADFAEAVDAFNNTIASADSLGVNFHKRVASPSSGSHTYGLKNNGATGMTYFASADSPSVLTIWEKGGA